MSTESEHQENLSLGESEVQACSSDWSTRTVEMSDTKGSNASGNIEGSLLEAPSPSGYSYFTEPTTETATQVARLKDFRVKQMQNLIDAVGADIADMQELLGQVYEHDEISSGSNSFSGFATQRVDEKFAAAQVPLIVVREGSPEPPPSSMLTVHERFANLNFDLLHPFWQPREVANVPPAGEVFDEEPFPDFVFSEEPEILELGESLISWFRSTAEDPFEESELDEDPELDEWAFNPLVEGYEQIEHSDYDVAPEVLMDYGIDFDYELLEHPDVIEEGW